MSYLRNYKLTISKDDKIILQESLFDNVSDRVAKNFIYRNLRKVFTEKTYNMFCFCCDIKNELFFWCECYNKAERNHGGYLLQFETISPENENLKDRIYRMVHEK